MYLSVNRIVSFCASALQSDVLPVPGGPKRNNTIIYLVTKNYAWFIRPFLLCHEIKGSIIMKLVEMSG